MIVYASMYGNTERRRQVLAAGWRSGASPTPGCTT
jgi:flavorubredoxin